MPFSREDKIAHVNKSPEAVAIHDKQAWLNIFSDGAVIEDPVGSTPHINKPTAANNPVSRFYDTFVAPNDISFNVINDYVCDMHVVRDLSVTTRMGKAEVDVPMHLLYELGEQNGQLKIKRLAAHWELAPMVSVLFKNGISALPVMGSLSGRMLKNQGISGAMGFMGGVGTLGSSGKRIVEQFFLALKKGDADAIKSLTVSNPILEAPHGEPSLTPEELVKKLSGTIQLGKILVAGYAVSCSLEIIDESSKTIGVAIFNFDTASKQINSMHLYYE